MEVEAVRGVGIGNRRKCEKKSLILEIHQKNKFCKGFALLKQIISYYMTSFV